MVLMELRCPRCSAPLGPSSREAAVTCRFCGASLREPHATSSPTKTRTVYAVSMGRVGPSNRSRIAAVLRTVGRLAAAEADRLVDAAPCELVVWEEITGADALREALHEAGAAATIETREVAVPVLPDRAVLLDGAGANKVAVIKVVRAHVDLGMAEAKQLVERAPCVLVDALEGARAAAFVAALTEAGANARLA